MMPVRTGPVVLPQCRCIVTRRDNPGVKVGDRCTSKVTDPDSPLCLGCQEQHQNHEDPMYEYRMVPLH